MLKNILNLLGSSGGRFLLWYNLLFIALKPFDVLFSSICRLFKSTQVSDEKYPIFIIGMPRSGSTILYQYLSLVLNVTYTSNAWAVLPHSGPFIKHILNYVPPHEFESYYGNGKKLNSVQEGGRIFNLWFDNKSTHYYDSISKNSASSLAEYFAVVQNNANKPFLIKNTRNGTRIQALSAALSNMRYIRIRRRPIEIARSILKGRLELMGNIEDNFTTLPEKWEEISKMAPAQQIAHQVFLLGEHIDRDLKDIPQERILDVLYEDFCKNPKDTVNSIKVKFPEVKLRKDIPEQLLNKKFIKNEPSKQKKDPVVQEIEQVLMSLYGEQYDQIWI